MNLDPIDPLSERELEILRLLAKGLSNRDIAQKLTLSLETIKWYNRQIYSKLDVRGRSQAASRARELGLLNDGDSQVRSIQQPPDTPARLPAFLSGPLQSIGIHTPFIGRKRELAWLQRFLTEAINGHGRTLFVEGSAGMGKSTLLAELARRALKAHPDLLVVIGSGSIFSGEGDPYLPFRELMALLTGDVERPLAAGAISRLQAQRLWLAASATISTLLETGPDLLDIFVPTAGLLVRTRLATPHNAALLALLEERTAGSRPTSLEQRALFSQFLEFLSGVAKKHPLLILLDDLHWVDDASLGLLFHVGRHLAGSRILVVGAYRPEGLAGEYKGKRHPLRDVLGELQRTYGEITIDLAAVDQDASKAFINGLLDAEPNRLKQSFRDTFFAQTAGHPLFSVELLHEMQKRGNLIQDEGGHWCEGTAVDWQAMPARVEAVIGQRIRHLDEQSRRILEVASVEGETFTAEIVAQVLQIDGRGLVPILSRDLVRQHRLIVPLGIERLEKARNQLTRYRFQHQLFQAYLYQELDNIERSYLHESVGLALETLYEGQLDDIAVRLARHFQEAGNRVKAVEYLRRSSERALMLSAYDEAIDGFKRALALVQEAADPDETTPQTFKLLMGLAEAQRKAGQIELALESFQRAAAIARQWGSTEDLAHAALGYEETRWRVNLPAEPAAELLEEAFNKLDPAASALKARIWVNLVRTRMPVSSPKQVELMLQQALDMARQVADPVTLFEALYLYVRGNRRPELSKKRLELLEEMLHLAEFIGSYELMREAYGFRLLEYLEIGDIQSFIADEQQYVAPLSAKLNQPFYDYVAIIYAAIPALLAGRFDEAEQLVRRALELGRQMGVENYDGVYSMQMFTIRREQGRLGELASVLRLITSQDRGASIWRPGLALLYAELDMKVEAQEEFDFLAQNNFDTLAHDALWVVSLVYLSEVCVYLEDRIRARTLYELLLPYNGRSIVVGYLSLCLGAAARYLALLAMTFSEWTVAQRHFEEALVMNEKMGAWPWLAHTQLEYSIMLLGRGRAEDRDRAGHLLAAARETAVALGMPVLVEEIEAQNRKST